MMDLESFERAFDAHIGSCSRSCECGKRFYNPDPSWDFEEGELEELENDPNATALDWSVSMLHFEGCEYVTACDCWQERAKQIMEFIDVHAHEIAEYLNLEKSRKIKEAKSMPNVVI